MASSITLSGLSLAADGKTLTATIGGGNGSYSPASGITNFSVYKNGTGGERYHQLSQAVAGTTLTVVLDTIIAQGVTPKADLGAGSNLTDSAANTPVGQTNLTVTNNSNKVAAASFNSDHAGLSNAGLDTSAPGTSLGKNYVPSNGPAPRWEFSFQGTDLDMEVLVSGTSVTPFDIVVDGGGSVAPVATATNTYARIPIFSGQADAVHTVVITRKNNCNVSHQADCFHGYGTGAAPTLPTGYGKSYPLKTVGTFIDVPAPWGRINQADGTPGTTNLNGEDITLAWKTDSGHIYRMGPVSACSTPFCNLMFRPDGSVWLYHLKGAAGKFAISDNGVESGSLSSALGTGGAYGWEQIFTGLSGTTVDETYVFPTRRSACIVGDSITLGETGPAQTDTRQGHVHILANLANLAVLNLGVNGQLMQSAYSLLSTYQHPDSICISWGTNNASAGTAQGTFDTSVQALLADARTKHPSARIVFSKILPRGDAFAAAVATYNGYIAADIAAVADGNTVFADVSRGFVPATMSSDGLHPNGTATPILANNWIPFLAATGYSISAAASGAVGSPVTLIFTKAAGSTWVAGEVVAVSDGGGGSFGAFAFTPGEATATMIYTPGSVGAKTLTPTNSQGWQDPAPASFIAVPGAQLSGNGGLAIGILIGL